MKLKSGLNSKLLPPLIFPGKSRGERKRITQLNTQGAIRQVAPRIYSSVPDDQVETTIRSSWGLILAELFPNAVISYRTALDVRPTAAGEIFLTSASSRVVSLPGLTLRFYKGPAADEDDHEFMGVKIASFERAVLESLHSAKGAARARVFTQSEIELRLERELAVKGESRLNAIRDKARRISKRLDKLSEFNKLDQMIGALLGTRKFSLKTELARSRSNGLPLDLKCLDRLGALASEIVQTPMIAHSNFKTAAHLTNKAFFESYFSNYIAGTICELREAEAIVFDKQMPKARPKDAHDILETYRIVADVNEMNKTPTTAQELGDILKYRHAFMFSNRPEVIPGEYKDKPNRPGNTDFVHPDYVDGTLARGFALHQSLPVGLPRAIFMMFLIADVHPFNDGNGRISRVMMNAELSSKNLSSIIIPTVFREDYVLSLRALTRQSRAEPFVRMLLKAHDFSNLNFNNYAEIKKYLTEHFWFEEPSDAMIKIV